MLEQRCQRVDELQPDAGMTAGEPHDLQQDHQAHDLVIQVLADAGGVRAHEVLLQVGEFVLLDPHLGELPETRVDAVDRRALGDHIADRGGGFVDPAPGALAQLDAQRSAPDFAQLSEWYRRAVEPQSHRGLTPGTMGRLRPCSRAQAIASS